jgi:hypothetical protein
MLIHQQFLFTEKSLQFVDTMTTRNCHILKFVDVKSAKDSPLKK